MKHRLVWVGFFLALFLVGCSGGDDAAPSASPSTSVRLTELDSFATGGRSHAVLKDGDYVYVTDLEQGLLVFHLQGDALEKIGPSLDLQVPAPDIRTVASWSLAKSGSYLYIAAQTADLIVVDLANPEAPEIASRITTPNSVLSVIAKGNKLFLCDFNSFMVFGLTQPVAPVELGEYDPYVDSGIMTTVTSAAIAGDFAYLASFGMPSIFGGRFGSLIFLDISSSATPRYLGSFTTEFRMMSVVTYGDYLLAGGLGGKNGGGLSILNSKGVGQDVFTAALQTTSRANPQVGAENAFQAAYQIVVQGHYAYIADGYNGISVVDLYNVSQPRLVYRVQTGGAITGIAVDDDLLVAADETNGVHLFRIEEFAVDLDTDGDGIPDMNDLDDDGDGRTDATDYIHPLDTDNDGVDNAVDPDDDNDGHLDADDVFPLDEEEWADLNLDGVGDNIPHNRFAEMMTSNGPIRLELFEDLVPLTTKNFISLAKQGYYDGVIFHRVILGFMNQGGDPTGTGGGGPGYEIIDEFPKDVSNHLLLSHDVAGTLSMANAGANTGGSQFFITVGPETGLDEVHTVFGRVVDGLDVVQAINVVPTDGNDKPLIDVVIESVTITTE